MDSSATRGNCPELWNSLLDLLDDKLQLGLLDHLKRVNTYHVEQETLYIEPANPQDHAYLTKDSTFQQLQVFAQDAMKVDKIKIRKI